MIKSTAVYKCQSCHNLFRKNKGSLCPYCGLDQSDEVFRLPITNDTIKEGVIFKKRRKQSNASYMV